MRIQTVFSAFGDRVRIDGPHAKRIFGNANNVLNHVNYLGYGGNLLSPFFGQPTRAGQARRVEVGLQFRF
jgi:hypothetical protein